MTRRPLDPAAALALCPRACLKRKDAHADRTQDARPFPDDGKGTLAKWLVKEGDDVKSGDPRRDRDRQGDDGVRSGRRRQDRQDSRSGGTDGVKVGAPIAILAEEGEDVSAAAAPKADTAPVEAPKQLFLRPRQTKR